MLFFSTVDHEFEYGPLKPKTEISICCFSTKDAALRNKSKDGLTQYQDNVYEWSDMST
jgi:hypothetical protein